MDTHDTIIRGVLQPDGTLKLQERVPLPPGDVEVRIRPIAALPSPLQGSFWRMMENIWADQKARGHVARDESDIRVLREEAEERITDIERLHEECQRGSSPHSPEARRRS